MFNTKEERRGFYILMFIVIPLTIMASGLKFKTWFTNGTFEVIQGNSTVVGYVRDYEDPTTTFTVLATGHDEDIVTNFPAYIPQEGQDVGLFRIRFETKTKSGPYYSWVIPKIVILSKHSGEFGLVADDSGRTNNVGYVREVTQYDSDGTHYTIPVDTATPHYFTLSLSQIPEVGDQINFWYLKILLSKDEFFNLAILY